MGICAALGVAIEALAYRPLRSAPRLNVLITAIGVSLFLENVGQVIFGSDPRVFPAIIPTRQLISGEDGLVINNIQVMVVTVSLVLMGFLHWIVHHTKIGTAMHAVSFHIEIANLMGIPTDRIIMSTFIIGSPLAGSASIL